MPRRPFHRAKLCGAVGLLFATGSPALGAESLPVEATQPASGATIGTTNGPVSFELTLTTGAFAYLDVEVASAPETDVDGTLIDSGRVGQGIYLVGSPADPATYRGGVAGSFAVTPGTYWWQASGVAFAPNCPDAAFSCPYLSAVYPLTVDLSRTTLPVALTRAAARSAIPGLIRDATGWVARALRVTGCVQRSRTQIRCTTRWNGGPTSWRGRFMVDTADPEAVDYRFVGSRARVSCIAAASFTGCDRTVRLGLTGLRGNPPPASVAQPRTVVAAPPTPAPEPAPARGDCDPSYPGVCIPPGPPDLDCGDVPYVDFAVTGSDPHRFDGNNDGVGCESD